MATQKRSNTPSKSNKQETWGGQKSNFNTIVRRETVKARSKARS